MVAITELRTTIAEAIQDDSKWQTFAFPPATVMANSVIVTPDDPYLTPNNGNNNSISATASFKLIMTVPLFDNEGNLQGIEDTMVNLFNKLCESNLVFNVGTISAPSVLNAASGDLLTSEMSIQILVSWS